MQTVSREMAKKLKDAGWEKTTAFIYNSLGHLIYFPRGPEDPLSPWDILAPTLDEVLEEVSLETLVAFYTQKRHMDLPFDRTAHGLVWTYFIKWLYTTMRSADAASEVWLRIKEPPCPT